MVNARMFGARKPERIEGARRDDQRMGRVETAGYADDDVLAIGDLQAFAQSLHLDVEGLVAIVVEARRIVGHEGEAVDASR